MNDLHVKSLHYQVIANENIDYERADPIEVELDHFILKMNSKEAIFEMKTHCSTKEDAKVIVDAFLRSWDVLIGLEIAPNDLRFVFQNAEIIDRAPPTDGSITLNVNSVHMQMTASMHASLHISRKKFPFAPKNFVLSPDVETMYIRFKAYREGRETLLSMAYMCLTVLETSAGNRKKAAKKYSIADAVLDRLGKLSSERGSVEEARKKSKQGFKPLSPNEKEWMIQVVKAIIRRAGEYANNPTASLPQLTMNDFPLI